MGGDGDSLLPQSPSGPRRPRGLVDAPSSSRPSYPGAAPGPHAQPRGPHAPPPPLAPRARPSDCTLLPAENTRIEHGGAWKMMRNKRMQEQRIARIASDKT